MSGLTSLFEPLYNIREGFSKGIGRLGSVKMPSRSDVKNHIYENRYTLLAESLIYGAIGTAVYGTIHHYIIDNPPTQILGSFEQNLLIALIVLGAGAAFYAKRQRGKRIDIDVAELENEVDALERLTDGIEELGKGIEEI